VELRRPEDDLVFELPRDGRDGFLVPWQRERDDLVESGSSVPDVFPKERPGPET
jgi:hypothetical protein